MNTTIIVLVVIALMAVAGFAVWYVQNQRTARIKTRFGPEYDRTVTEVGDRRKAEQVLDKREKRVKRLQIRTLAPGDRQRFADSWRQVQAQFVDDPLTAVTRADRLVADVLHLRGYPVADFEQRAADISVDHPVVVENYRAAHEIALKHQRGEASTEELRQGMVYYRTLFEELLGAQEVVHGEVRR